MNAISGFCEKCIKFRKGRVVPGRYCDGNRNTCMSILLDTIEALQAENEQLHCEKSAERKAREVLYNLRMDDMKREKMKSNIHQNLKQQIRAFCPYPNHFCNGQPIPDEDGRKEAPKEPCKYYKFQGTFKSGCSHPERR